MSKLEFLLSDRLSYRQSGDHVRSNRIKEPQHQRSNHFVFDYFVHLSLIVSLHVLIGPIVSKEVWLSISFKIRSLIPVVVCDHCEVLALDVKVTCPESLLPSIRKYAENFIKGDIRHHPQLNDGRFGSAIMDFLLIAEMLLASTNKFIVDWLFDVL